MDQTSLLLLCGERPSGFDWEQRPTVLCHFLVNLFQDWTKYNIVQNHCFQQYTYNIRSWNKFTKKRSENPRTSPITQARFPSLSRKPGPPESDLFDKKCNIYSITHPIVYCLHIGHRLHLGAHWIHTLWHRNLTVSSPKLTVLIARVWNSSALRQHGHSGSFSICSSMVARFCAINSVLVFLERFSRKADFSLSSAPGMDSSVVLLALSQ